MSGHQLSPTTQAWQRLSAGPDAAAFTELFREHHNCVYNYCFRRLADWGLAEEAAQRVFLALWRRASQGRVEALRSASELAVLLGMARHECLTTARSRGRRVRLQERVQAVAPAVEAPPTDRWVDAEATMAAIHASLAHLPAGQRDVVELVWWSGLSLAETAQSLEIPIGTVKSRLARARVALAESELANLEGR